MKWNIDKALATLERALSNPTIPGTMVTRTLMDVRVMEGHGLRPKAAQVEAKSGMVWCLAVGVMLEPKEFFYGHTIREAYLKARRVLVKPRPKKTSSDAFRRRPRRPSP